ncbi:MAG: RNA 2',3'-cyclic phosphodiesterase [Alphaproteobacteria bacterium]|nr:RNA 2',3'-cyclic phosphodiesterase [Alphaproteobacteria bacterium]
MKTIRLFAALSIPGVLKKQASALPRKGLSSPRWSHPDDLHITLRFIGDVDESRLPEIEETLEHVRVKPFTIVAKGLDIFARKKQKILYIPIESRRAVTNLSAEVTERLNKTDFEFPLDVYTPHITLARLSDPAGLRDYVYRNAGFIRLEWKAESFFLFRSADPDAGGKRYSVVREYPLRS